MKELTPEQMFAYVADLRNKYSRLNTYFSLMEECKKPDAKEGIKKMFEKCERDCVKDNERFVKLLKTDPQNWKDDRI